MALVCAPMIVEATTWMMVVSTSLFTGTTSKVLTMMARVVICPDVHPLYRSTTPTRQSVIVDVALLGRLVRLALYLVMV